MTEIDIGIRTPIEYFFEAIKETQDPEKPFEITLKARGRGTKTTFTSREELTRFAECTTCSVDSTGSLEESIKKMLGKPTFIIDNEVPCSTFRRIIDMEFTPFPSTKEEKNTG